MQHYEGASMMCGPFTHQLQFVSVVMWQWRNQSSAQDVPGCAKHTFLVHVFQPRDYLKPPYELCRLHTWGMLTKDCLLLHKDCLRVAQCWKIVLLQLRFTCILALDRVGGIDQTWTWTFLSPAPVSCRPHSKCSSLCWNPSHYFWLLTFVFFHFPLVLSDLFCLTFSMPSSSLSCRLPSTFYTAKWRAEMTSLRTNSLCITLLIFLLGVTRCLA